MAKRSAGGIPLHLLLLSTLLLGISHFFRATESAACNGTTLADAEAMVPTYLKSIDAPEASIEVHFPVAGKMQFGAMYLMSEIQEAPSVLLQGPGLKSSEFYTLMTVDPDGYETRGPRGVNILHLLVANIPGSIAPSQDALEAGDIWVDWFSPAISANTTGIEDECHRHMYLLFGQGERKISSTDIGLISNTGFSVLNFASVFRLGFPFAGFLYRDYADVFHALK